MVSHYWSIRNSLGHEVGCRPRESVSPLYDWLREARVGGEKADEFSVMLVVNGVDYPEPLTPEYDKLESLTADGCNQHVGQFLEWMGEMGWEICVADDVWDRFRPLGKSVKGLIAEWLGIDEGALEREKLELMAYLRVRDGGVPSEEREELGL